MTKNDEYVVDIIDYGMDGEGIAKIDNIIVFVPVFIKVPEPSTKPCK